MRHSLPLHVSYSWQRFVQPLQGSRLTGCGSAASCSISPELSFIDVEIILNDYPGAVYGESACFDTPGNKPVCPPLMEYRF
jgi:hypothetical protein